jgi:hypothetical protein
LQAQSLTICGKIIAGLASARGSALCKHNHLLPIGRQWQDQYQRGGLHFASIVTYLLWEDNGRISISKGVCTLQAQSLTYCGKAMAGSASTRRSALCKNNHLLPVGRQWQDQHQQEGLYFTSTITYLLWEDNGRISISKGVCTLQAQSLTRCGKAMAGSASARGSVLCKHNHSPSVRRQWQDQHQQGGLHFANTITYIL